MNKFEKSGSFIDLTCHKSSCEYYPVYDQRPRYLARWCIYICTLITLQHIVVACDEFPVEIKHRSYSFITQNAALGYEMQHKHTYMTAHNIFRTIRAIDLTALEVQKTDEHKNANVYSRNSSRFMRQ